MQSSSTIHSAVFTIGHSTHRLDLFVSLLKSNDIDLLVDTRSYPLSKYASQFDQDNLQPALKQTGIRYLFVGRELGGRPKDTDLYDEDGRVLYWKIAASRNFQESIQKLLNTIAQYRVVLLCSEEDPRNCHRRLLIGRVLGKHGVSISHIRGNGTIQTEHDFEHIDVTCAKQLSIFSVPNEEQPWKSTQSVLRRKPLLSSSNP